MATESRIIGFIEKDKCREIALMPTGPPFTWAKTEN